jgi:hypothetical protein
VDFIETNSAWVNDVCVSITHKHRPWKGTSFRMAQPLVKDLQQTCIGHLAGTFMRVHGNCQYPLDAALKVAEVAREARDGASFTRSMVARAVQCFGGHRKYQTFYKNYRDVLNSGYDGYNRKYEK